VAAAGSMTNLSFSMSAGSGCLGAGLSADGRPGGRPLLRHEEQNPPLTDAIAAAAAQTPSAIAIDIPGERLITYSELLQLVDDGAKRVAALGLAPASRVALVAPNAADTVIALLALSRVVAAVPLNPACTRTELRSHLRASGAAMLTVLHDGPGPWDGLDAGIPVVRWASLRRYESPPSLPPRSEEAAFLFQTSGTTASPRIVALSHRNVLAGMGNVARALDLTVADACLVLMPLFHVHGLIGCALATLYSGGRVVLPSTPRAIDAVDWLETRTPTWYSASPAVHQAICARSHLTGGHLRHSLRLVRSASAPLSRRVRDQLYQAFGVPVLNAYGMTEASHQIASTSIEGCEHDGDVGMPLGCEVLIRREDGSPADPGEVGEIWVRGENVGSITTETDRPAAGDWLRTGDLGRLNAHGRLSLTGRAKEIINKGGEKISPGEVEAALLHLAGIEDATVFGFPDDRLGEQVAAAIVPRPGFHVQPEDLQRRLAQELASFKVPSRIVVVDRLPRGPTGKVLRRELAAALRFASSAPSGRAAESGPWSIADALVELWKEVLHLEEVGLDDDFFELGGDSLAAADLVFQASERFRIEPSLTSFFAEPTVAAMARAIQSQDVAPHDDARALVPLRASGTRAPLLVVHGTSFSVDHYRVLVRHLRTDVPVYGIQEDLFRMPPYLPADLPALARHYVEIIRKRWPRGPYRLAGASSAGAIVAEMACTLRRSGVEVERVILIDAYPLWLRNSPTWLAFRIRQLASVSFREKAAWLRGFFRRRLHRVVPRAAVAGSVTHRAARLTDHLQRIARSHRPGPLDAPLTLLVTREAQVTWRDPHLRWASVASHLDTVVVSGTHQQVLSEPHVAEVAARVSERL
jgi:oxalate---CoA ligase